MHSVHHRSEISVDDWDMHYAIEQSQHWINHTPLYQCETTVSSEPISLMFIDRGDAKNLESMKANVPGALQILTL
jgi:hypothetical protein